MRFFNKKGQNTAEYAILIALVIGAAVAMQTYVKRSMQGGVKFAVDKIKKTDTGSGQYEPYYLQSSFDTTQSAYKDTTQTGVGGAVTRTIGVAGSEHATERSGTQTIVGGGANGVGSNAD